MIFTLVMDGFVALNVITTFNFCMIGSESRDVTTEQTDQNTTAVLSQLLRHFNQYDIFNTDQTDHLSAIVICVTS